jgi:hypothetical protein
VEDVRWSALGGEAEAGYRKAGGNVESREVHGCDCEGVFPRVEDVPGERAHDFDINSLNAVNVCWLRRLAVPCCLDLTK